MVMYRSAISSLKYHLITGPAIRMAQKAGVRIGAKLREKMTGYKRVKQGRKPGLREQILRKTRGSLSTTPHAFDKGNISGVRRRHQYAKKAWALRQGATKGPEGPRGPSPIRSKVLKKTRGQFATNPKLFKRDTISGNKRRVEFAKAARATVFGNRPKRSRTGTRLPKAPGASQNASGQKAAPRPKVSPHSVEAPINASRTYGQLRRRLTGMAVRSLTRDKDENILFGPKNANYKIKRGYAAVALAANRQKLKATIKARKLALAKKAAAKLTEKG